MVVAIGLSLEAFGEYAACLHEAVGNLDLVARLLTKLLDCSAAKGDLGSWHVADESATADTAADADNVGVVLEHWCLDEEVLRRHGPGAVARLLLLQRVASVGKDTPSNTLATIQAKLLEKAPTLISEAPTPVAHALAGAVASVLRASGDAVAWLRCLQAGEGTNTAYMMSAGALLRERWNDGLLRQDAWEVARSVMAGANSHDRHQCVLHLIPALVEAENKVPKEETTLKTTAAARVAGFAEALLANSGRSELFDALELVVAFRGLVIDHWQLSSGSTQGFSSTSSDSPGLKLIAAGLRLGLKEYAAGRKHARLLLQTVVQTSLAASTNVMLAELHATAKDVSSVWSSFWTLYDSLEEYASHLLKASWDACVERLMKFFTQTADVRAKSQGSWPAWLPSPQWFEVLLCRAISHDNDTVMKYVMGQLICLDQATLLLSETFVLEELLPRMTHSVEFLYPKTDVHQVFERQVARFFSTYAHCHGEGPGIAAQRLLHAISIPRMIHHMPLRLLLLSILEINAPESFCAREAVVIAEQFLSGRLRQMPNSTRLQLAALFLRLLGNLVRVAEEGEVADVVVGLSEAASAVPDALLDDLASPLATLARRCLGDEAGKLLMLVLRGATSSRAGDPPAGLHPIESAGLRTNPMSAVQVTLGVIRLMRALALVSNPCTTVESETESIPRCTTEILAAIAPTLTDVHRRPYIPRRAVASALFAVAYASVLFGPNVDAELRRLSDLRDEILAYLARRVAFLLELGGRLASEQEAARREEVPWIWLYAFTLERLWQPGLPCGEDVAKCAAELLQKTTQSVGEAETLAVVAAAAFLGAVAPKIEQPMRRADFFNILLNATVQKPAGLTDLRFSISDSVENGTWNRVRVEEHEEVSRVEREGLARVMEWRDALGVFLVAKWRALACLSMKPDHLETLRTAAVENTNLITLSAHILDELDSIQSPHSGFWAIVARRVAYPLFFNAGVPYDEQKETLCTLCRGLSGMIAACVGDGSGFVPQGTMAELAAALCDQTLCQIEQQSFQEIPVWERPFAKAVQRLLSLGESGVGVSRAIAVPLLVALFASPSAETEVHHLSTNSELLMALLLHQEATIEDGAFSHAPDLTQNALDKHGSGGATLLASVCSSSTSLRAKFKGTSGLPRVLTLGALDTFISCAGSGPLPQLVVATLRTVLAKLKDTLTRILCPPGSMKPVANRPPTPMPGSPQHREQIRGWQALLVLGGRADEATAQEFLLHELFWHLATPHVPDVRDYQELLGCLLCSRFDALAVRQYLVPALARFDVGVQVSASLLVISCFLFRTWGEAVKNGGDVPQFATDLLLAIAPYLQHNSAYARGTAAWGFFYFVDACGEERAVERLGPQSGVALSLYKFLQTNKECVKMRGRTQPIFARLDPEHSSALELLTEFSLVLPGEIGSEEKGCPLPPHTFRDGDFRPSRLFMDLLKQEVAAEMEILWNRSDPTLYPSISDEWRAHLDRAVADERNRGKQNVEQPEVDRELPANTELQQRKYDPETLTAAGGIPSVQQSESVRVRQPLIVIASLVDKTPNLAGLCRTSEVFNCEALCMPNVKMAKDQVFQSMSVTAEKWLPLREVPPANLCEELLKLRQKGYELVGVEQTHNSVPLDEWRFADGGTVLVLGAEKEGICPEVLPLLDGCVEIPQAGQIRSLNVHVSGSLAIWEYTKQRRSRSPGPAT